MVVGIVRCFATLSKKLVDHVCFVCRFLFFYDLCTLYVPFSYSCMGLGGHSAKLVLVLFSSELIFYHHSCIYIFTMMRIQFCIYQNQIAWMLGRTQMKCLLFALVLELSSKSFIYLIIELLYISTIKSLTSYIHIFCVHKFCLTNMR